MSAADSVDTVARFYRDGDAEGLLQVLVASFGGWPGVDIGVERIEHLRWKLRSHPDSLRYQVVAEAGSTIIGSQLFLIQDVKVGNRLLTARHATDQAVHPDHQRRGVFTTLRRFREAEMDGEFDFQIGGYGGHTAIKRLRRRIPQQSEPFANRIEVLTTTLTPGDAPDVRDVSAPDLPSGWTASEPSAFDERIDGFWGHASQQFQFAVARTSDYLNWRFCDPRAGKFTIKLVEERGRVLGYAALCVTHTRAVIADLLALPGREDVAEWLVRDALRHFHESGVSRVECWLPAHHPYRGALQANGFTHKRRTVHMDCRALQAPGDLFHFLRDKKAALHFTAADTDLV